MKRAFKKTYVSIFIKHLLNYIIGTSKPVYYRVLLNENYVAKVGTPLTSDILQCVTYHMTFQYGTATKSVRSVPVVYYSSRLANMGLSYVGHLQGQQEMIGLGERLKRETIKDEELVRLVRRDGSYIPYEKFMRATVSDFCLSDSRDISFL